MTATERVRELLDNRGVEWRETALGETRWLSTVLNGNVSAKRINDKLVLFTGYKLITPEQAVEATLGRGTCHNTEEYPFMWSFTCSECGVHSITEGRGFNFCPNCGRRVVDE